MGAIRRRARIGTTGSARRSPTRAGSRAGWGSTRRGWSGSASASDEVELRIEQVDGRHAEELTPADLELAAGALGRAQGAAELPADEWLSRGYLRSHSDYPANWALLDDDAAWSQPLIRDNFPAGSARRARALCTAGARRS